MGWLGTLGWDDVEWGHGGEEVWWGGAVGGGGGGGGWGAERMGGWVMVGKSVKE